MIAPYEDHECSTSGHMEPEIGPGCRLCGEESRAYTSIQGLDFCEECAALILKDGPVPDVMDVLCRLDSERQLHAILTGGTGEP